jgi:hypothetical protein
MYIVSGLACTGVGATITSSLLEGLLLTSSFLDGFFWTFWSIVESGARLLVDFFLGGFYNLLDMYQEITNLCKWFIMGMCRLSETIIYRSALDASFFSVFLLEIQFPIPIGGTFGSCIQQYFVKSRIVYSIKVLPQLIHFMYYLGKVLAYSGSFYEVFKFQRLQDIEQ